MKPKIKAGQMWANSYRYDTTLFLHPSKRAAKNSWSKYSDSCAVPVAVIPLDDQAALIAKATAAFLEMDSKPESWLLDDCMTAALVAIGVLPRARKGRK